MRRAEMEEESGKRRELFVLGEKQCEEKRRGERRREGEKRIKSGGVKDKER